MELTKNFEPTAIDAKWYQHSLDKGYFNSTPDDRESYTVVMPPPNVTGVLHMGHCLNNTIQDILVRRARMVNLNYEIGAIRTYAMANGIVTRRLRCYKKSQAMRS